MKKTLLLLLILFSLINRSSANHITGGTIYYERIDKVGNNYTYRVTLLLYRDHNSTGAQLDNTAYISVFNRLTGAPVVNNSVPITSTEQLHLLNPNPCINNPPDIWYDLGTYTFTVTLPGIPEGYTIAYQRCCRIAGINNLIGSNNVGATYTAEIPGTAQLASAPDNNSATFGRNDMVIICAGDYFCYNFGATDRDTTDRHTYSFCSAYVGGGTAQGPGSGPNTAQPNPPLGPPYFSVPYNAPEFGGDKPLGPDVTLDPNTGMLCGIAPPPGIYVVTVCVTEYRQGIAIATQRKDLQIKVGDCDVVKATLPASFPICDDFSRTFQNLSPPNPLVTSYFWDFGDGKSSDSATPTHTYADTGRYKIKLVVNRNDPCGDSVLAVANVYPGFFPAFSSNGVCVNKPSSFFDNTTTRYGTVSNWSWNFGDVNTIADTSRAQNPVYTYNQTGTKNVSFIVSSSKGCIDTVNQDVIIIDKPAITLLPADTLICNGDQVQLKAAGIGNFSWTGPNITNANSATPTVSPTVTSQYIVQIDDNGCINFDTAQVRVVDFVTLQARPDTVICATDAVQLSAFTNGLRYNWTPAATLNNATVLAPVATPTATTTYRITATIGHCVATDDVTVTLVPYPIAQAGPDTTICFSTPAHLHASMVGNSFIWSPTGSLNNPSILDPIASPVATTRYILTVHDILGCPKPRMDTVVVTVLPKVNAFAGRDTAVVIGQPLQFNGEGGVSYAWSPPIGLNRTNIADPVGLYDGSNDSIRYKLVVRDQSGCADSAYVLVKVFKTSPQIFVPTAFTPNGDGRNDVFRPIAVGITRIEYFRVYNRWGQLVFSTTVNGQGWDGKIGGKEQGTAAFAWLVKGVDFTGKVVFAKGTVTLIR